MKGGWRLAMAVWTGAIAVAPAPLAAQSAPPQSSDTPATDTVGPRELKNFSLSGTVTRPAEPQPAPSAETRAPADARSNAAQTPEPHRRTQTADVTRPARSRDATAMSVPESPPPGATVAAIPQPEPQVTTVAPRSTAPAPSAALKVEPATASATIEPQHHLLLWPWLLAGLAAAAAGAFVLLRNRSRPAFAGGAEADFFAAPEPAPIPTTGRRSPQPEPTPAGARPEPAAAPPPKASPPSGGIVSTGLRPWVEVGMRPLRCIVDDAQVTIEFELELFNSGTAAARAVLVEAMAFNAGPTQDQEVGAFFAKPAGEGDRIDAIPPLQRISLRTQVIAPRENVQVLDAGGRQVFVPLIAFNALYGWNGHTGQTSVGYLLGRETSGDKMAPFRIDLGPRQFRNVGARPLPGAVRQ